MARGYRPDRIGEEIRRIIGDLLLQGRLKDPRLHGLISITAVDVTSDYSYATVYFTVLGSQGDDEAALSEVMEGFESSKGFIRSKVGSALRLRHTPELIFKADRSLEYGRHIDAIIETLEYGEETAEQAAAGADAPDALEEG